MVVIMFFGRMIAGIEEGADPKNQQVKTYLYHTFVFLQIFNEINCRKIGRRDFNVFENLFHNWYFLFVVVGTFSTQILSSHYFPGFTGTVPMTRGEWGACIAVGSTVFIAAALLKLTPEAWVEKVPTGALVDEDKHMKNKVLDAYNQVTQAPGESEEPTGDDEGAFTQV